MFGYPLKPISIEEENEEIDPYKEPEKYLMSEIRKYAEDYKWADDEKKIQGVLKAARRYILVRCKAWKVEEKLTKGAVDDYIGEMRANRKASKNKKR
jgi:hypothetical protein